MLKWRQFMSCKYFLIISLGFTFRFLYTHIIIYSTHCLPCFFSSSSSLTERLLLVPCVSIMHKCVFRGGGGVLLHEHPLVRSVLFLDQHTGWSGIEQQSSGTGRQPGRPVSVSFSPRSSAADSERVCLV